jgi:hypothetical protein
MWSIQPWRDLARIDDMIGRTSDSAPVFPDLALTMNRQAGCDFGIAAYDLLLTYIRLLVSRTPLSQEYRR